jgi:cysteine synthase
MNEPDRDEVRRRTVERCREREILIPTFAEMRDPTAIDPAVAASLAGVDLQAADPRNLFRITWHNDVETGGFGEVNALELPPSVTGVPARIVGLLGSRFPTQAHKVGAAFGCLVPRLVAGEFDPTAQAAVWPSTGNYCRGGAFDCALLGCRAVAILPEGMSRERFHWLEEIGAEIIPTPGTESNVKEIFDACWEIRRNRPDVVIFNQFEEFGNYLWHFGVTGPAAEEAFRRAAETAGGRGRLAAWVAATGSAGTLGAGDYLKKTLPGCRIVAAEALQCPTLLRAGFGEHRIEGIGDKHVPWIHNVRNTDVVMAIDDAAVVALARLFNEAQGQAFLVSAGVPEETVKLLPLLGFSGIANVLSAMKLAKYYELARGDIVLTVATDSMELYESRLREHKTAYSREDAVAHHARYLSGATTDHLLELSYRDRRRVHNLKYYTWVEQQGKTYAEIQAQWYDPDYWTGIQSQVPAIDELIQAFNARVSG